MASLIMSATEFKAKCSAVLDDVQTNGNTVIVTKRGRPVATIGPAKPFKSLKGCLEGIVVFPEGMLKDETSELWEALIAK
jgi:prevent-host-death family protein